ncbi:MAG: hypothetical protein AAFV86_16105 [Pseudomonadota bacterium]
MRILTRIALGLGAMAFFFALAILTVPEGQVTLGGETARPPGLGDPGGPGGPQGSWKDYAGFLMSLAGLVVSMAGTGFSVYFAWRADRRAERTGSP